MTSTSCNANAEARGNRAEGEGEGEVAVYKKGAWSEEEDEKLRRAAEEYGIKNWVKIERLSGLGRPAKNCRLRWLNYLRPNLKKHPFTDEEEKLILDLHFKHGNCWARIASQVAGRSDNEIKNFWHKRVKKCKRENLPIYPTSRHTNGTINQEPNPNAKLNTSIIIPNHTLNTVNNAHHPPSIHHLHSPQTMIPSQFLSSPSTLLLTSTSSSSSSSSSYHLQSPTTIHFSQHPTPTPLTISHHLQPPAALSSLFTKPPPILSERPFFRATSQLSPPSRDHSASVSANLVVNASPFQPPDSSAQIQWSSAMDSPTSTLKLDLSPQMPPRYSGFQLHSPTTPPLKVHSSCPLPSESCFQSNLSIPDSTVQLKSSIQLELSQPMTVDSNHTIPPDSPPTVKGEPPSIQSHQPETSGVNSCKHEEKSVSNLEIMDQLREAQARVRFLKKKLRKRRISNKGSLLKVSRLDQSSEVSDLLKTQVPLDGNSTQSMMKDCALSHPSPQGKDLLVGYLRVDAPPENSRENEIPMRNIRTDDMIGISKPKGEVKKKAKKEYPENLESGEDMQGRTELEKRTQSISSESRISSEKSLQRQEDLLDHLKIQNSVSDPLHTLQGLAGKYSNECSSMEGFLSESCSTMLHDSLLKGDLFSQTSHIEHQFSSQSHHTPPIDAFGQFCNQNSATTLARPGDEGVQLSYLQSDDGLMVGNLAARSMLHESNVLMHQNSTSAHLPDSNYMGCEQFSLHNFGGHSPESQPSFIRRQYHAADLLDSGYLTSKQLTEQEPLGGACFSLQTDGCGRSSGTPNLCESTFLLHQSPESSLIDARYLVGFEHESQSVEQYYHQTWKQYDEPNTWPERHTVFQDQIFAMNSLDPIVNPMECMNWNNESTSGYTGDLHQEQEQDYMTTMPEELLSLLDFFPTTVQTLEWCNTGNEIPNRKASDELEHDMSLGLQMSSTSQPQPLITIADYI